MVIFFLLGLLVSQVHALEMSKGDFCLSQAQSPNDKSISKFKIEGNVPHPALVSTVSKLVDEFEIQGPLVFHFTDYQGPRKVWSLSLSSGKHIYFARNAIDLLLGLELEKIADEVCRPEWTGRKTFTVAYTNTVMEQFLRQTATKESLVKVLSKKTGWKLRSSPSDTHFESEQEFRTEELITLVKQLMDIPSEVFEKMKIRKVTRWRHGAPLPVKGASAMYFIQDQKIIIGDGALMDSATDVYGEGTILHEMGHAFWFGVPLDIRNKFTSISWKKNGANLERIGSSADGFVSEYAMKSPEEDFAEHFSAYMYRPELLQRKASRKKRFFEDNVFMDTTFFSTVAENAKVKITSPTPDTTDPWLVEEFPKPFKTYAKVRDDGSKVTDVSVEVSGAKDDLSGIDESLHTFVHIDNDKYSVTVKLVPEPQSDGTVRLSGTYVTDPDKLAPGQYRSRSLGLKDKAGNKNYFSIESMPEIFIDGNLSPEKKKAEYMDLSLIKMRPAPVIGGYHGVITTLPIKFQESLDSIHVTWEFSDLEGKTVHVCQNGQSRSLETPCFISPKVGGTIVLQSYFHKQYPRSIVKLASLHFEYKGTATSGKSSEDYIIPQNLSNTSITIDSGTKELKLIDLDVNSMKLRAVSRPNEIEGDQNIEITIPLINHMAGKFKISTTVRSPTEKHIYNVLPESLSERYERIEVNGVHYLKFQVPLKKNPEDGVYILESFETSTEYERPFNPSLPLDLNHISVKKIKLLERGIRRTFTITDDKIINLN